MWGRDGGGAIGLIAGQGEFPVLFAKAAASVDRPVIAFGIRGIMDPQVSNFTAATHYVELGELGRLIDLLKSNKVKQVVFAGAVPKKRLYDASLRLDDAAQQFMKKTPNRGDDHLLRSLEIFLKLKCGTSVLDSRSLLKQALSPKGVLTRRKPTPAESRDLKLGFRVAKQVGKMDVGQTVVVKGGVVLAVEALEGTDQAIRRGGELGKGGAVVVKVSKPNQDLRFDLPCVGVETVKTLRSVSAGVLGVEAGKTILISKEKFLGAADEAGLCVVGL